MNTQPNHWEYTITEWSNLPFTNLLDLLPKFTVLYDIGANVGGFSHILLQRFPDIKVYAWEPVKDNFDYLTRKLPAATCFQDGIFYGKTSSRVMWRGSNIGGLFVEHIDSGNPALHRNNEIITLKELESYDIPKPDLIKLDVEGAEENIIQFSTIVKECPNLIIEWHPSKDPLSFFALHLPNHEVTLNIENNQFLLCLKSL